MNRFAVTLLSLSAAVLMATANANAELVTVSFLDDDITFPGYEIYPDQDVIITPEITEMTVTYDSENNQLTHVSVFFADGRLTYDNLFINTNWDGSEGDWQSWDYFVRGGESSTYSFDFNTLQVVETHNNGLYTVNDDYDYQLATVGRVGHPNGISFDDMTRINDTFQPLDNTTSLIYDFTAFDISLGSGFVIGYDPYCGNDVIIGEMFFTPNTAPVPEPATMFLLGAGLAGLVGFKKRKKNNTLMMGK